MVRRMQLASRALQAGESVVWVGQLFPLVVIMCFYFRIEGSSHLD